MKLIKLRDKLLKLIFYSERGRSSVIGRIYGPANEILQLLTFLGVYGFVFKTNQIILFFCFIIGISIIIGILYVKLGFMKTEQEFVNKQNPTLIRMEEILNEIKSHHRKP